MDSIDINLDEISLLDDVCIGDDSIPQDIDLGFGEVVYVDNGVKDHEKLNNLDYASSGHIGFASSQEVEEIRQQIGEIDLGAIQEQVDANSDKILTLSEQVNGIANDYLNSQDKTELQGNIDDNGEQIEALSQRIANVGETASDNTQSINALSERMGKVESDYLTSSDKQEIENSVNSVSSQVEGVATRVGTLETNSATKTEVQAVQTNLDTYKTENNAKVKQNSDAISILNGVEEGSVDYAVKKGINDFAKVVTDNDTVDTFAEVVTFIANHGNEFSALVGAVDKNTNAITTLKGDESVVGSVAYTVQNAIENENLSQYALDSDLGELSTKVDGMYTNEQIDSAVSNAISTASNDATSKANTAKTEANAYTDSAVETLNTAIDGKQPKGDYALNSELGAVAKSNDYNDLNNKPTIPNEYTLPTATSDTLGGVKVGEGLQIDESGTLSNKLMQTVLVDTWADGSASNLDITADGIEWEENIDFKDANGSSTFNTTGYFNAPIVAGNGISIDINENQKAEISATLHKNGLDGYLDTYFVNDDVGSNGIQISGDIEICDGSDTLVDTVYGNITLPIVAGEGISITKNSNGKAEISANGLATESYVDTKVADLVNSAPETLNTLGELATAIQNHEDEYDALLETVGNKANSSDLATVARTGSYNDLSNKPTIPSKTSQLTNDSGFLVLDTDGGVPSKRLFKDVDYLGLAPACDEVSEDGLSCFGTLSYRQNDNMGGVDVLTKNININLPIVAGDGINITTNGNEMAEISSNLRIVTFYDSSYATMVLVIARLPSNFTPATHTATQVISYLFSIYGNEVMFATGYYKNYPVVYAGMASSGTMRVFYSNFTASQKNATISASGLYWYLARL